MINPLVGMPQGLEWLVILAIVVLVFGAAKLPDLARSSGQALRIFKTETKDLRDDDKKMTAEQREIEARNEAATHEVPGHETTGDVVRERRDDTTA
jgi:sec-independent protein translocase protein TatA